MEFELELYNRYLAGCDEDEEVLSFEDWLVWSSEEPGAPRNIIAHPQPVCQEENV